VILYGTRVPVVVWQVRLRTAISVYFTLPARIAAAAQIDQSHLSGGAADVNKTLSNSLLRKWHLDWFFGFCRPYACPDRHTDNTPQGCVVLYLVGVK